MVFTGFGTRYSNIREVILHYFRYFSRNFTAEKLDLNNRGQSDSVERKRFVVCIEGCKLIIFCLWIKLLIKAVG